MLPLHLQSESHIPLYVQLRDQLRALVHSGELRTGRSHSGEPRAGHAAGRASHHCGECLRGTRIRGTNSGARGAGNLYLRRSRGGNLRRRRASNGNGGAVRWEALFADERGEEGMSRLTPEVPKDAIGFVAARPPEEYFPDGGISAAAAMRFCATTGARCCRSGRRDGYRAAEEAL